MSACGGGKHLEAGRGAPCSLKKESRVEEGGAAESDERRGASGARDRRMSGRGDIEGQASVKERLLFCLSGGGGGVGGRRRTQGSGPSGCSALLLCVFVASKQNQSTVLHFKHKIFKKPKKFKSFGCFSTGLRPLPSVWCLPGLGQAGPSVTFRQKHEKAL